MRGHVSTAQHRNYYNMHTISLIDENRHQLEMIQFWKKWSLKYSDQHLMMSPHQVTYVSCFLLLILMLWHRQVIFKSKAEKQTSCLPLLNAVFRPWTSETPDCQQTECPLTNWYIFHIVLYLHTWKSNRVCHPGGSYWDCYPGVLSLTLAKWLGNFSQNSTVFSNIIP